MVAKRGPGSRARGAPRQSTQAKAIKPESKAKKSQQTLRLSNSKSGGNAVSVGRTVSADFQAFGNMAAFNQEALLELNEHRSASPRKILAVLRMAKKDCLFSAPSMQ